MRMLPVETTLPDIRQASFLGLQLDRTPVPALPDELRRELEQIKNRLHAVYFEPFIRWVDGMSVSELQSDLVGKVGELYGTRFLDELNELARVLEGWEEEIAAALQQVQEVHQDQPGLAPLAEDANKITPALGSVVNQMILEYVEGIKRFARFYDAVPGEQATTLFPLGAALGSCMFAFGVVDILAGRRPSAPHTPAVVFAMCISVISLIRNASELLEPPESPVSRLTDRIKRGDRPDVPEEQRRLAGLALDRLAERRDEDVEEWAEILAQDLAKFDD